MKLRYLFLAAVLFAGACSRPSETFSTGIIPVPQHVNWGEGTFRMPRTLTYVTDLEGQEKADLAAWMERSVAGRFFPVPFVEALRLCGCGLQIKVPPRVIGLMSSATA